MDHAMHGKMSELDNALMSKMKRKKMRGKGKVGKVMHEFKAGTLHSGSKSGPKVTNRKQAIAIGLSEAGMSRMKH